LALGTQLTGSGRVTHLMVKLLESETEIRPRDYRQNPAYGQQRQQLKVPIRRGQSRHSCPMGTANPMLRKS